MSTNPPSFRLPFTLDESVHESVKLALRAAFNAIFDHDQAISSLKTQLTATQATIPKTASTTPTVKQQPSQTPSPGTVNDQTGATSYILQQSDYGGLVILNSASPVAVTANSGITKPWFATLVNNGAGTVTVTPDQGTINGSASVSIAPGGKLAVYANSADLNWSAA